jgi:hypothetical protein
MLVWIAADPASISGWDQLGFVEQRLDHAPVSDRGPPIQPDVDTTLVQDQPGRAVSVNTHHEHDFVTIASRHGSNLGRPPRRIESGGRLC